MNEHRFHLAAPGQDVPSWHTSCGDTRDWLIDRGWRLIFTNEDVPEWACAHSGWLVAT